MDARRTTVHTDDGCPIAVTHWASTGRSVVLLHAGVADRRAWDAVGDLLSDEGFSVVAYDRRGFGETPAASDPTAFTHVGDLLAVLDALRLDDVVLVGNSMGGALALDTALLHPDRVSGLVLVGAAVSGMTDEDTPFDWVLDPASAPLLESIEADSTPCDARIDALAHLWLDGPTAAAGRVGDPARALFAEMNRVILDVAAADSAGDAGVDAWTRLGEIAVPVVTAWGELDIPADLPFYVETAGRLGQGPGRVVDGVAHLPGLERPDTIADLVREIAGR